MSKLPLKHVWFVGKTITEGTRAHPSTLTITCQNNCSFEFQGAGTTSKTSTSFTNTTKDNKLSFTASNQNENIFKLKPCDKEKCPRIITEVGHYTSGLTAKLQQKLEKNGTTCYKLKQGFGKNETNTETQFIRSSKPKEIQENEIKYVNKEGTLYAHENPAGEEIRQIFNNE